MIGFCYLIKALVTFFNLDPTWTKLILCDIKAVLTHARAT